MRCRRILLEIKAVSKIEGAIRGVVLLCGVWRSSSQVVNLIGIGANDARRLILGITVSQFWSLSATCEFPDLVYWKFEWVSSDKTLICSEHN